MKKILTLTLALIIFIGGGMVACKKDEVPAPTAIVDSNFSYIKGGIINYNGKDVIESDVSVNDKKNIYWLMDPLADKSVEIYMAARDGLDDLLRDTDAVVRFVFMTAPDAEVELSEQVAGLYLGVAELTPNLLKAFMDKTIDSDFISSASSLDDFKLAYTEIGGKDKDFDLIVKKNGEFASYSRAVTTKLNDTEWIASRTEDGSLDLPLIFEPSYMAIDFDMQPDVLEGIRQMIEASIAIVDDMSEDVIVEEIPVDEELQEKETVEEEILEENFEEIDEEELSDITDASEEIESTEELIELEVIDDDN